MLDLERLKRMAGSGLSIKSEIVLKLIEALEFKTKALEQAIQIGGLRLGVNTIRVTSGFYPRERDDMPELATELEGRK